MATLAIIGHKTRGREVIEILEMLGGKNRWSYEGDRMACIYYLNNDKIINYSSDYDECALKIFTLEKFLEKFPYKVWDKVKTSSSNDNCVGTIISMRWNDGYNEVVYTVKWDDIINSVLSYRVQGLQPYKEQEPMEEQKLIPPYMDYYVRTSKEETMEEIKGTLVEIDLTKEKLEDKVEIILNDDYEVQIEDGKTYIVKKHPQYPNTYEECCEVLDIHPKRDLQPAFFTDITQYEKDLDFILYNQQHLLICRDAYWKLAGDWKPDWTDNSYKNIIYVDTNRISKGQNASFSKVLAFPTEEMRDAFYENFKDLIEQCKELL